MNKLDKYFLGICDAVSQNSNCLSRKIGTIVVKDKSIISTGYNGPPRGVPHCDVRHRYDSVLHTELCIHKEEYLIRCPRQVMGYKSGEGLEWCTAGHSERNALINAAKMGISTDNCMMYMNCGIPCVPCLIEIINAGIKEIVVTDFNIYDKEPSVTKFLLEHSSLITRNYNGERYE